MEIIIYGLGAIVFAAILCFGLAFILKINSPYKDNSWQQEHNQRILKSYSSEIIRYDVLLSFLQNALKEAKTDIERINLNKDIIKVKTQKEKYLKSVGFLFDSK